MSRHEAETIRRMKHGPPGSPRAKRGKPTLRYVDRRRIELWALAFILLLALAAAVAVLSLGGELLDLERWASPTVLRVALLLLTAAFCAFIVDRELHLRRLTSELINERVLREAYETRLRESTALVGAARTINEKLELEDALRTLLDQALALFRGTEGSLMLLDGAGHLETVCYRGNEGARGARLRLGEGIAGRVALTRQPVLVLGKADPQEFPGLRDRSHVPQSAMSVPLIHREELLGVLNVSAGPETVFTEHDLQLLAVFAGSAAVSMANARLYETERSRVAQLMELSRLKSEFVSAVSHELRTPMTSILGGLRTLERGGVAEEDRVQLLASIRRQSDRLWRLLEQVLTQAGLEGDGATEFVDSVDLGVVVRTVAADVEARGHSVALEVRIPCRVRGSSDLLQQALWNLVDNAFTHGAPPVRVVVGRAGDRGMISVTDRGPGVPPSLRERIFERFSRLHGDEGPSGVGLGLSVVRSIVAACGGTISVADAPGGGAIFRISLPLADEPADAGDSVAVAT